MKLASILAAALVALPAAAQQTPPPPPPSSPPPPPPTYTPPPPAAHPAARPFLGARLGVYMPSDDQVSQSFNDGFDLEGFVGFPLNPYLAIVGGIGYSKISTDTVSFFDPSLGNVSGKLEVSDIPIDASLRLGTAVDRFSFYGLGGVGYHFTSLKVSATVQNVGSASESEDDSVFGWHLGAGIGIAITPRVSVGAELRQTWVEANYPNLLGDKLKLDGLRIGGVLAFTL